MSIATWINIILKIIVYLILSMLSAQNAQKLIELTSKAVAINKELLRKEEEFISAVSNDASLALLKIINERIFLLNRKETLFLEVTKMMLEKMAVE